MTASRASRRAVAVAGLTLALGAALTGCGAAAPAPAPPSISCADVYLLESILSASADRAYAKGDLVGLLTARRDLASLFVMDDGVCYDRMLTEDAADSLPGLEAELEAARAGVAT